MVNVTKKVVKGKTYYYLEHSYRDNGDVRTETAYLGPSIPKDVEDRKTALLHVVYQKRWFPLFERLKAIYTKEHKRMPSIILEKENVYLSTLFTYHSNKIEGSSLTHLDTSLVLNENLAPMGKPLSDVKEAEAHRDVFNEMVEEKRDLSLDLVLHWHERLFSSTKPDYAGKIRTFQVYIGGSKHIPPPPEMVRPRLTAFFKWYEGAKKELHPVELAALVHLKFVAINPFGDGNGRTSRMLMNFILHRNGYPILIIRYEKRKKYYKALERTQVQRKESIFIEYIFKRYVEEHARYMEM